jgi:hypothetical protein
VEVVDESGAVHQGVVEMDDATGKASVILSGVASKPKTIRYNYYNYYTIMTRRNAPSAVLLTSHTNRVDPEQKVLYSLEMNPGLEILTSTAKQAQARNIPPTHTSPHRWRSPAFFFGLWSV